ncbi:MAG: BamA/TamA family outer membrane protein [Armatimonadetes bacterium]|nr:BamA/TamA family outer membrane protein [Armatimonadota bacterium]
MFYNFFQRNYKFYFLVLMLIVPFFCRADLIIRKVNFEGNHFITDKELSNLISSNTGEVFNQKTLNQDAKNISELYSQKGFYNVKIHRPEVYPQSSKQVDIIFKIEENEKLKIDSIFLTGNRYFSKRKLFENLSTKNLSLIDISSFLQNILEIYLLNGFLFADVKLDSLKISDSDLNAFISIDEGKSCHFEEYFFEGNKTTKDETLLKLSQIENVKNVTPELLNLAEENIRKQDYILNCNIIPINDRQLVFQIEEDRMTLFSAILGFDNSQINENKLTGFINLDFLNLFGTGRALSLFWQRLSAERSLIELQYHETGFKSYPINGDFLISREEVDSTYVKTVFETEIYYYDLINKYGIYLGVDDIFPGSRRPKIIQKNSYKKIGVFWEYNNLDNFYNPQKGKSYYLKYYNILNKLEGENQSKNAIEISWQDYQKIMSKFVLAFSLNAKVIENKKLTDFDFFNLGGSKNLRGFNENQFYGYRIGWTNLEIRYILSRKSRAFVFTDYGYAENKEYRFGKLFGFGFGLRIETRLGMLGIDYGFGYSNGKLRNPVDGIIHFGIESKL